MKTFWIVASLVGSPRRKDVEGAINFIASFGDEGVEVFRTELRSFHRTAEESGLTTRMEQLFRDYYHEPTERDVRAAVESVVLAPAGPRFFDRLVGNPQAAKTPVPLETTFEEALSEVLRTAAPQPSGSRSLKDLASLRRDGSPWISINMYIDEAGGTHLRWPFSNSMFLTHLSRHAVFCSQSQEWIGLRTRYGFRELDVSVDFGPSSPDPAEREIEWSSTTRIHAVIPRGVPHGDDMSDAAEAGDTEAAHVMNEVRQLLEKIPDKPSSGRSKVS